MKGRIHVLPQAHLDLKGLAAQIARRNIVAARRLAVAAEAAYERLLSMPELGNPWESSNPMLAGIRFSSIRRFKNYLIFYRATPDGIEILRLLHGARDIDRLLDETFQQPVVYPADYHLADTWILGGSDQ